MSATIHLTDEEVKTLWEMLWREVENDSQDCTCSECVLYERIAKDFRQAGHNQ